MPSFFVKVDVEVLMNFSGFCHNECRVNIAMLCRKECHGRKSLDGE